MFRFPLKNETHEMGDEDSNSDCELVIDETIVISDDENEFKKQEDLFKDNIFHPMSIAADDMKEALFNEDTNTCNICNESFRYNIGLICHLEMEHLELKIKPGKSKNSKKTKNRNNKNVKLIKKGNAESQKQAPEGLKILRKLQANEIISSVTRVGEPNSKVPTRCKFSCTICKKTFSDKMKWSKHRDERVQLDCTYCKLKFCWESKYKKHLFRTHKLDAAVICKLCSQVFSHMTELARHSEKCRKKNVAEVVT